MWHAARCHQDSDLRLRGKSMSSYRETNMFYWTTGHLIVEDDRTFNSRRWQISSKSNFLGLISIVLWVSVPGVSEDVRGWGWSGRPSSCTLVSSTAAVRSSSPKPRGRFGFWVERRLPEPLWRRTPSLRLSSPSEGLWAACTCTRHRGRCRGKWPWSQLLEVREEAVSSLRFRLKFWRECSVRLVQCLRCIWFHSSGLSVFVCSN